MPFFGNTKALHKPPFLLQASTCIWLARTVSHDHTGSLTRWAWSFANLQNDLQTDVENVWWFTKSQCLPQLHRQMRENRGDREISLRDWNYLDGILEDFTKHTHTHKSKLWVEVTSRKPCLQKHSHLYNILSHFHALENFHPWQKSNNVWNRI